MIPSAQPRGPARPRRPERGAALVEFALVSLVLYLLLAGAIEFGRLMFDANALQDVARVAARELAVAPVRAEATFDYALRATPRPTLAVSSIRERASSTRPAGG